MNDLRALVIDDEPDIGELLKITLERMGIQATVCNNYKDAIVAIQKQEKLNKQTSESSKEQLFDICLTDMKLPDGDGLDIVSFIQEHTPKLPVTVITAHGSIELAITALKRGAFDFITKPINLDQLRTTINNAIKLNTRKELPQFPNLIGSSAPMLKLKQMITQVARSQAPVYISGQSGSGKELVAHYIHQLGVRSEYPIVTINCGAIPKDLVESEFFGYTKGSFTGATSDKKGLFEAANKGTLFLDEVADLPISMQVKLLRAIQEQKIRPIGSNQEISIDVRIISATHKDLSEQVKKEKFRQDLFYRLNVIEINVPSLAQRKEDISELIDYILEKLSKNQKIQKPKISDNALERLQLYQYPGNIRELENILERAMTLCSGIIDVDDLYLNDNFSANQELVENSEDSLHFNENDVRLYNYLENIEKEAIISALKKFNNNKLETAKALGITLRALRYRLKKLNITD